MRGSIHLRKNQLKNDIDKLINQRAEQFEKRNHLQDALRLLYQQRQGLEQKVQFYEFQIKSIKVNQQLNQEMKIKLGELYQTISNSSNHKQKQSNVTSKKKIQSKKIF